MSKIVTVLVEVLIFTSVIAIIASSATDSQANLSGAAKTLMGLVALFVVIGFVLALMKTMGVKTR